MEEKKQIKHILVPEHIKVTEEQKNELLKKYNISLKQMPKILATDPALSHMQVQYGDVIMIRRKSPTVGETEYYRAVVNG